MDQLDYRNNLEDILAFTNGRHLLSVGDVMAYTGFLDSRTVNRRYPMIDGYISAPVLARCLCKKKK